jgi:RNA polymerase sigma-70 factor, ECF subfamily
MREGAAPRHKHSALTQSSLDRLLTSLDPERERAGELYEIVRRKLLKFFDCRASPTPEDDADETINRVARRLADGEAIENMAAYFYGVARLVLLESGRQHRREVASSDAMSAATLREESSESDIRLRCLEQCLQALPAANRELLVAYYEGDKGGRIRQRHQLADAQGLPINALRIRVHRLRVTMEECVRKCVRESHG